MSTTSYSVNVVMMACHVTWAAVLPNETLKELGKALVQSLTGRPIREEMLPFIVGATLAHFFIEEWAFLNEQIVFERSPQFVHLLKGEE